MDPTRLDDCVAAAAGQLEDEGLAAPQVLLLMGTGTGTLPGGLLSARRVSLGEFEGTPPIWQEEVLHVGRLEGTPVWLLDDAPGNLEFGEGDGPAHPPWERAFPVWLAAEMGASLCLITAAGGSVCEDLRAGELAVLSDHLNLSGTTPLSGLGKTRLGPLFPDQSTLHHQALRSLALERAGERGIALSPRVAACVQGPALTTPAERAWFRSAGAELFVQGLAGPLLASAHAGLAALTLVAVTDDHQPATEKAGADGHPGALNLAQLVASADRAAPALEDLINSLAGDLSAVARELEAEYS